MGLTKRDCVNAAWDVASEWRRGWRDRIAKRRKHAPTPTHSFILSVCTWTLFLWWYVRFRVDL
jgi:hypothetical protein